MNRREAVVGLLALCSGSRWESARAQARMVRIGVLGPRPRSILFPAVLQRLGELGYVNGKNLVLENRSADNLIERFPALARELVEAKCDLIFAVGSVHPVRALLDTRASIPIVILAHDYDPLRAGIIANLRRPGGNITGMMNPEGDVASKRLELMREAMPKAKRFFVLADGYSIDQLDAVHRAAKRLDAQLTPETFGAPPYDYDAAFRKARAAGVDAVIVLTSPVFTDQGKLISQVLMQYRIPAATFSAVIEEQGFLIGYGIEASKAYAPAAEIAVRILKGAKPADIAVEQVTHFELVVNLQTARQFGIAIPQSIAVRADRAIH